MFRINRILIVALMAASLIPHGSALGAVYHVDSEFQGMNPTGETWRSAYPTLPMAIAAAAADGGGEIWVKRGVYKPSGTDRGGSIELAPNITLLGGFRGGETDREARNPKANRTVLSGDIGRIGSTPDNSHHVVTAASGCRIDGFIIQRGNADAAGKNRFGGGLLAPAGTKGLILSNCVFEKNNAGAGGAIHLLDAELTLTNCTFFSNAAESGGAIALEGESKLAAMDSILTSNHARGDGGAISAGVGTDTLVQRSSFILNSAAREGGALFATAGSEKNALLFRVEACRFLDNSATTSGGGAMFRGAFTPVVVDSAFEKNFSAAGAGGVASAAGTTTVLTRVSFARNRGAKGSERLGVDTLSRVVESTDEGAQLAGETRENFALWKRPEPAEIVKVPPVEPRRRTMPDTKIWTSNNINVKLRSMLTDAKVSVVVLGELTDPKFIANYRSIEAIALNHAEKSVKFLYLYRYLSHPQNNGFLPPYNEKERARQTRLAKEYLSTSVPWAYDVMDNQAARALAPNGKNAIFAYNAEGEEIFAGEITASGALRKALRDAVGSTRQKVRPKSLPAPRLQPVNMTEPKYAPRVKLNPQVDRMEPLQITPLQSNEPYYVKIRVEGNEQLLGEGSGKIYLAFMVDPLYKTMWNNLGDPVSYSLKTPQGVIAPSVNAARRVTEVPLDSDPREFILDARKLDLNKPIPLQVSYSVRSMLTKKNIEVTQRYIIYPQADPCGGEVIGRHRASRD